MHATSRFFGVNGTLKRSFDDVVDAAEALRAGVDETDAEYRRARKVLDENVRAAKSKMSEQAEDFADEARRLRRRGDRFVRANPWASIGVGAAVGFLAGLLARGR